MQAAALTQEHRAAAPAVGADLRAILMGLAALVAHAFLRDPRRVALIRPLWNRLTHAARRFDRLMARVAAGKEQPRPSRPGSRPASPSDASPSDASPSGARPPHLPTSKMWLVVALGYHGAAYMCRLQHLLSDPKTAELIASVPQAVSLLRPLCRMLGVTHPAIPPRSRRRPAIPSATPAEPDRKPAQRRAAIGSAAPAFPAPSFPAPAFPAPIFPATHEPPNTPLSEADRCPHFLRWPWVPHPSVRPR